MYEIQDFIYAEMRPRAKYYTRFNGTVQHLLHILETSESKSGWVAAQKIKQDSSLRSQINSGYSLVLKEDGQIERMYENSQRPCDKSARAAVLDIERTIYTIPGWFSSTYGMGTRIVQVKLHKKRITAVSIAAVLIFSYTIHRCCYRLV